MKEFIEKLISRLEEAGQYHLELSEANKIDVHESHRHKSFAGVYGNAISIVKELAEEHKGGWIPCSERLPDTDGWYYTTEKYGKVVESGMCKFQNGKWEHCDSDITTIAWQCRPQPYKEMEDVQNE